MDLTLAHPIGVAEVAEGTVEGTTVSLTSTAIVRTATGSPVTEVARRYHREGARLLRVGHGDGRRRTHLPRPRHVGEGLTVAVGPGILSGLARDVDPGPATGGVLTWMGQPDAANVAWAVTTAVALVAAPRRGDRTARRQPGVDVIALLAMGGSLALEEYLAGARSP